MFLSGAYTHDLRSGSWMPASKVAPTRGHSNLTASRISAIGLSTGRIPQSDYGLLDTRFQRMTRDGGSELHACSKLRNASRALLLEQMNDSKLRLACSPIRQEHSLVAPVFGCNERSNMFR